MAKSYVQIVLEDDMGECGVHDQIKRELEKRGFECTIDGDRGGVYLDGCKKGIVEDFEITITIPFEVSIEDEENE